MAYTVYICIDNISYLNPKIGFIEKPQLLDTNSIIIEKLQNSSLSPIYICSLWLFICFIILNEFLPEPMNKKILEHFLWRRLSTQHLRLSFASVVGR